VTTPAPEIELYEHEKRQFALCAAEMLHRYMECTTMGEELTQNRFRNEAFDVFADRGFKVFVEFEPDVSDDPTDNNVYYKPRFSCQGRTDPVTEGFDHDQQQREVVEGVFDGKKGYIDTKTGLLKDDSKKKIII
jgi:hypothetical protein